MLTEKIFNYKARKVRKDLVVKYGDMHDGVIEFPGIVEGGVIETGYFYGDDKKKNIIAISSQIGCMSKCSFCELGDEKFVRNLSAEEMYEQVVLMLQIAHQQGVNIDSEHKVNLAKTGEPLLNDEVVRGIEKIGELGVSFKLSTLFPKSEKARRNFYEIADFASRYSKPVQGHISLISTSEEQREQIAGIKLASFEEIGLAGEYWHKSDTRNRKVNLSLMLCDNLVYDADEIREYFSPEVFRFRLRNYIPTENGSKNGLKPMEENRFDEVAEKLENEGYDVSFAGISSPVEKKFGLAANVTRKRYLDWMNKNI